jgi:general secretion pathway protein G
MGIIAAVAAPKMFDTTNTARKNSAQNSLTVLRNAIELYKGKNEAYPGAAGSGTALATDLTTFLNGPFPKLQINGSKKDGSVKYETDGNGVSAPDGTTDWLYDTADGTLKINVTGYETL